MPISDARPMGRGLVLACLVALCAAVAGAQTAPDVVVVGPPGYCVDEEARRARASGSFVLLGLCDALGQEGDARPEQAAVLTALVSPPTDPPQRPSPEQMRQFFLSEPGQAALAHDGNSDSVEVLSTIEAGDVLYLKVKDGSSDRPEDLETVSWRAAFPLLDRLVALSVTGHVDEPIGDEEARVKLRAFVEAMIAANTPARPQTRPDLSPDRPKPRPEDES